MAVSLKGANDDKSTNSMIARSMGMGGGGKAKAGLQTQNPGHNKAPVKPKPQPQMVAAAPQMPGMPSEEAIRLGMPSAMAALKARRDGPPVEEKPLPMIKSKSAPKKEESDGDDDEDDDLDAELGIDKDDALSLYREKRMAELKAQAAKQQEFKQLGHGTYTEIKEEEFLPTVTKSKYAVCAFYHVDFERCKIVDKHLSQLAREHGATKFVKLNAEKAPFFVQKLAIKTLPTVVMFKDGIAVDRITGFEDFGGVDDFKTELMARRIAKKGVIVIKKEKSDKDNTNANIRPATNNDDDAAAGEDGAAADDE